MTVSSYNAVIRRDREWWIGWIEEVPGVNSQGTTREELISNLREALAEALEMNREDARRAANEDFVTDRSRRSSGRLYWNSPSNIRGMGKPGTNVRWVQSGRTIRTLLTQRTIVSKMICNPVTRINYWACINELETSLLDWLFRSFPEFSGGH